MGPFLCTDQECVLVSEAKQFRKVGHCHGDECGVPFFSDLFSLTKTVLTVHRKFLKEGWN